MVKIRLRRMGAKKAPFLPHRCLEIPVTRETAVSLRKSATTTRQEEPSVVKVDPEKAKAWMEKGAQPTDTVKALFKKHGVI